MIDTITKWIEKSTSISAAIQVKIGASLLIIITLLGLYFAVTRLLQRLNGTRPNQNAYLKSLLTPLVSLLMVLLVTRIWIPFSHTDIAYYIEKLIGISPDIQYKIFISFFTVWFLWILRKIILKLFFHFNSQDARRNYKMRNTLAYVFFGLGFLLVMRVWFDGIGALATYLGLLSAGVAIALKDPIINFAAWIFIMARQPFEIGDRIQIGENAGDVIDIRIFQFTINEIGKWVDADQSTGRIIHIPNAKVFNETQANYTKGFGYIWNEIPVLVTFESDWQKTKLLLTHIINAYSRDIEKAAARQLRKASQKYIISYSKLTPIVYTDVRDDGVLLTIRYLCVPQKRRITKEVIWESILIEFSKHKDIDLAYKTIRSIRTDS